MHSKSDDIEIIMNDQTDEIIKWIFDSLKNRYQNNLESVKSSEFIYGYFHLFFYKYHKINVNCVRSHIDSPGWMKIKKVTINPINKNDDKCFQYALTVALNYEEIKKIHEQ